MALTTERVRELLDYDQASGIFRWRQAASRRVKPGNLAGTRRDDGYIVIRVDGRLYRAHVLAILHVTGHMPETPIDHRDGVRHNNAWTNLREVTPTINARNTFTHGATGVELRPSGNWRAQLRVAGRKVHLGTFNTFDEAKARYLAEKALLHPGWTGR
jgi:hypothetical protein